MRQPSASGMSSFTQDNPKQDGMGKQKFVKK